MLRELHHAQMEDDLLVYMYVVFSGLFHLPMNPFITDSTVSNNLPRIHHCREITSGPSPTGSMPYTNPVLNFHWDLRFPLAAMTAGQANSLTASQFLRTANHPKMPHSSAHPWISLTMRYE